MTFFTANEKWLLERLHHDTYQPTPEFALEGTLNWIRALAEIVNNGSCNDEELAKIYSNVQKRDINKKADTLVYFNIIMALHNLASLKVMQEDSKSKYDISRSAIVSWYYCIYFSASAMIAAKSGNLQEEHATTAKAWEHDIVRTKLIPTPFDLHITTLVKDDVEKQIKDMRGKNTYQLKNKATNVEMAYGGLYSYLQGTCKYKREEKEEEIMKRDKEFKELGVENFRTKAARNLRDDKLKKASVNFLTQAFRFRGKSNYRDSIFLTYGDISEAAINTFIEDLYTVAVGFMRATTAYSKKRVEKGTWEKFLKDVKSNLKVTLDESVL